MRSGKWLKQICGLGAPELKRDLSGLLEEGHRMLESLSEAELEVWYKT